MARLTGWALRRRSPRHPSGTPDFECEGADDDRESQFGLQPVPTSGDSTGSRAYVANHDSDDVSVVDPATDSVIATIGVGDTPNRVAITPDGSFAYVTNYSSSTVSVIDTTTNSVTTTVPVGGLPFGLAITPDGDTAYVTSYSSSAVSVIETRRTR